MVGGALLTLLMTKYILTGGLHTGASGIKTEAEAAKFGGQAGVA
jgi:hypothetical protein